MGNVAVVTSCSAKGWEKYGARFVATFDKYWPTDVDLHVVSEDFKSLPIKDLQRQGYFWSLYDNDSGAGFLRRNHFKRWMAGDASEQRPPGIAPHWRTHQGYWFRYDAYKFCKKVFAIELVAHQLKQGRLFWIDADVVTFAPVEPALFESVLPSDKAISHLSRPGYHSECGFVGYNLSYPGCLGFISLFSALYSSEAVFQLPEWHDSWVFDHMLKQAPVPTHTIPHRSTAHPFINSELGQYMDHLKGGRKERGRSSAVEQLKYKKLPYWQGQ